MQLQIYLNYGGNCEAAFKFYEQHLGGRITMLMKHGEQPGGNQGPAGWENAVLHARLSLGGTELLGADMVANGNKKFEPAILAAFDSTKFEQASESEMALPRGWWARMLGGARP